MPLLIIDTVARRARGVVTAAEDGCVRVFQLASPRKVATFQGLLCLFVRACVTMSLRLSVKVSAFM